MNPSSRYSLKYEKGTYVYADKDTLGVMVFKTKAEAKDFLDWQLKVGNSGYMIKRVIPIGRGRTPKKISRRTATGDLRNFYKEPSERAYDPEYYSADPVRGTVCYPGVYVVD